MLKMKKINDCIVFSDDIERILKGNNALDFNYEEKEMIIPSKNFIDRLRNSFKTGDKNAEYKSRDIR